MKKKLIPILSYFKPYDYLLVTLAIVISFIPLVVTTYYRSTTASPQNLVAVVKISGQVADEFPLKKEESIKKRPTTHKKGIIISLKLMVNVSALKKTIALIRLP